jgi:hypothetical protein
MYTSRTTLLLLPELLTRCVNPVFIHSLPSSGGHDTCTRLARSLEVANLPPILAIDGLVNRHGEIIVTRKKLSEEQLDHLN